MRSKYALFAGAFLMLASVTASAQPARDPVQGDPVAKTVKPSRTARATRAARSDKQAPGTENGNQPDRAAAGGGAH